MEHKQIKKHLSKGERLGWPVLKEVQKVDLSSVTIRGKRVTVSDIQPENSTETSYIIP